MSRSRYLVPLLALLLLSPARAGLMDDLLQKAGVGQNSGPGNDQTVAGLKEALSIGTVHAVTATSKTDGYFGNPAIKILDRYVTNQALAGLYYLVAQEEIRIRKDPAARVTDLLKTVFGRR